MKNIEKVLRRSSLLPHFSLNSRGASSVIALFKKSMPTVAWWLASKLRCTNWRIKEVLPVPESPKKTTSTVQVRHLGP